MLEFNMVFELHKKRMIAICVFPINSDFINITMNEYIFWK